MCPSTLLLMVRAPAGSPYETSTNRRADGSLPRRTCQPQRAVAVSQPAAIGAGFVRLASGRMRTRPAGARVGSAPDLQAPAGAQARRPPRPAGCRPRPGRLAVKSGVHCRYRKHRGRPRRRALRGPSSPASAGCDRNCGANRACVKKSGVRGDFFRFFDVLRHLAALSWRRRFGKPQVRASLSNLLIILGDGSGASEA